MKSETPELTKSLNELSLMLKTLFQKMKESMVRLQLMNQPHDKQFEGEPIWCYLSSLNPSGVQLLEKRLVIEHNDVIYRIRPSDNKNPLVTIRLFLKWVTESLGKLVEGILPHSKILEIPHFIVFFSTSTLPPRKPVPIW